MSESQIREKLAASTEISDTAKNKAIMSAKKLGEGFMNPDFKPAETPNPDTPATPEKTAADHVLKSDVQVNDPRDPVTSEKLKTVLQKGAFNFNPRERDVLSKILSDG